MRGVCHPKIQLWWPKQGPQPSPAQPSSNERMTQPSSTATTDGMGTRGEGQIPESFLRQSVPIKVRVTVGKLKQNQELQRSTEALGEGGQEGWGGTRGPPQGTGSHHQPGMQHVHTVYRRNLVLSASTPVSTLPHITRWPESWTPTVPPFPQVQSQGRGCIILEAWPVLPWVPPVYLLSSSPEPCCLWQRFQEGAETHWRVSRGSSLHIWNSYVMK